MNTGKDRTIQEKKEKEKEKIVKGKKSKRKLSIITGWGTKEINEKKKELL